MGRQTCRRSGSMWRVAGYWVVDGEVGRRLRWMGWVAWVGVGVRTISASAWVAVDPRHMQAAVWPAQTRSEVAWRFNKLAQRARAALSRRICTQSSCESEERALVPPSRRSSRRASGLPRSQGRC